MNQYLVEYKLTLPGNMVRNVINKFIARSEQDAERRAEEWERTVNKQAEVQFIETIQV